MRQHHILYFSTNVNHIKKFHEKALGFEQQCFFRLNSSVLDFLEEKGKHIAGKGKATSCNMERKDLIFLLDKQENYKHLYVIVDYLSLFNDKKTLAESSDIVRRAILKYPEVNFMFDQTGVDTTKWISGLDFLLGTTSCNEVIRDFHVFSWKNKLPFWAIMMDFDNTFDGTNLRYVVRNKYFETIYAVNNFSKLQNGRKNNLAISVEEEPRQNRFNSFALYANGFRVIPVQTARMLLAVNMSEKIRDHLTVVVRDCDLQFPDVREGDDYTFDHEKYKYKDVPLISRECNGPIKTEDYEFPKNGNMELIDYIRDYKVCNKVWIERESFSENHFWNNTISRKEEERCPVIFVTNGLDKLKVSQNGSYFESKWMGKMKVSGKNKPICGLYTPFEKIGNGIVAKTHKDSLYKKNEDGYKINKQRVGGNHSVPLDVYDMAKDMLERAEKYYKEEKYIRAAVVASETIEVLDGFHNQMMAAAYHIKAIAENAIALDVIGANEVELEIDADKRIGLIKDDVCRLVSTIEKKSEKNQHMKQVLNHIFSDCRAMCRDSEYHSVESVFISAIAHGNDGFWSICKKTKK